MKPIEYRARIEVDEQAGFGVEEYAKEKLRMRILSDQQYQKEILKEFVWLKEYLESQIKGLEEHLKKVIRVPLFLVFFRGKRIREELNWLPLRIDDHKHFLFIIERKIEALTYQLSKFNHE